jgi:hypothetical protein
MGEGKACVEWEEEPREVWGLRVGWGQASTQIPSIRNHQRAKRHLNCFC